VKKPEALVERSSSGQVEESAASRGQIDLNFPIDGASVDGERDGVRADLAQFGYRIQEVPNRPRIKAG
jgi:hypothetical protein